MSVRSRCLHRTRRMSVLSWPIAAVLVITPTLRAQSTAAPDSARGRRRIQPLPAIGSAPETGMQLGATVLAVFEPAPMRHARPASVIATAVRSTKGQTRVSVDAEYWSAGNARRLQGALVWQRYPLPFYGVGVHAPESARETYTPTGIEATFTTQQRIDGAWYAVAGVRMLDQTIRPDSTTGTLRLGTVEGSRGGRVVEYTLGLQRDSRDHVFQPTRGTFALATVAQSPQMFGSEFAYRRYRYDMRHYRSLGGAQVLAVQAQATYTTDNAPFDQLSLVGSGDILRGYARGRYRGTSVSAAQMEYRTGFRARLGAVVFGGVGALAHHDSTGSHALALPTYGAGLRVLIDPRQRTAVRVDYGRGRDGASGLYIGFNQAF